MFPNNTYDILTITLVDSWTKRVDRIFVGGTINAIVS